MEAAADQEIAALRTKWGSQFDDHVAAGKKAVSSLGLDPRAVDALHRSIGGHGTMSLLAALGSRAVTDQGTGKTTISITDPTAARAEIARLSGDRAFQDTLRDTKNPTARQDALQRWQDLHAAAYPEPEPTAPTPVPSPAPTPTGTRSKRDAAAARIEQLRGDPEFQERMRQPGPGREDAVRTWNILHQDAYAPEGGAQ
jgi:hypothetical protein